MSGKKTETQNKEKVITKYDRKMERRRKEQEREAKIRKCTRIVGIVVAVCLAVLIIGSVGTSLFKRYTTFHGTYMKVGEHELTKFEYDYYYYSVINNYLSSYSYMLSYMGIDTTKDYDEQVCAFDERMTWKDYFDEMTVAQIQEIKALTDDASAAGFSYDVTEDYNNFLKNVDANITTAGVKKSQYYKEVYGEYANESRIEDFVKETLLASAYYEKLTADRAPLQEEIDTQYAENKNNYDTVSYRSFTFTSADVTSESEEAARKEATEKLQESANAFKERLEAGEDFNALCAEYSTDETAKANYEDAEKDYSLSKNMSYTGTNAAFSEWLFEEARSAGDMEIVPDETNVRCYIVKFEERNKDEEAVNQKISDTLAGQAAGEYVSGLVANYEITDVAGKLKYLTIPEEETTAQESTQAAETAETESTNESVTAAE